MRDNLRETGFPAPGRPVKNKTAKAVALDEARKQAVGLGEMFLPDDVGQHARTHPGRQRLRRRTHLHRRRGCGGGSGRGCTKKIGFVGHGSLKPKIITKGD